MVSSKTASSSTWRLLFALFIVISATPSNNIVSGTENHQSSSLTSNNDKSKVDLIQMKVTNNDKSNSFINNDNHNLNDINFINNVFNKNKPNEKSYAVPIINTKPHINNNNNINNLHQIFNKQNVNVTYNRSRTGTRFVNKNSSKKSQQAHSQTQSLSQLTHSRTQSLPQPAHSRTQSPPQPKPSLIQSLTHSFINNIAEPYRRHSLTSSLRQWILDHVFKSKAATIISTMYPTTRPSSQPVSSSKLVPLILRKQKQLARKLDTNITSFTGNRQTSHGPSLPTVPQIKVKVKDTCNRYDVNGCSVPFGAPFFFKALFTKCCDRHDICYHCGTEFAINRKDCDEMFRDNMWTTCLDTFNHTINTTTTNNNGQSPRIPAEQRSAVMRSVQTLLKPFNAILTRQLMSSRFQFIRTFPIPKRWDLQQQEQNSNMNYFRRNRFSGSAQSIERNVVRQWFELLRRSFLSGSNNYNRSVRIGRQTSNVRDISDSNNNIMGLNVSEPNFDFNNGDLHSLEFVHGHLRENVKNDENVNTESNREAFRKLVQTVSRGLCYDVMLGYAPTSSNILSRPDVELLCGEINLLSCRFFHDVYFMSVRAFGSSSYHRKPEYYCGQEFVKTCLKPIDYY